MNDIDGMETTASGRFVLRLDPALHERLRREAADAGLSLNEYCGRKLAMTGPVVADPAAAVLTRARVVVGEGLMGLVAFGSWVRGDAAAGSDVDVLVVVEEGFRVTRALYRAWDVDPLTWEGRPVEAHMVTLPTRAERVSGLWAEASLDGVVLSDRGHRIARYLAGVRRRILAGELERRVSHGQPYWMEVA